MNTAEKLQHLKLVIGAVDVTLPRESWPAPGLPEGIPKGAVVEMTGPCKFEWFIQFLKTHPETQVFWAEKEQQVLPTALAQRGIDLRRVSFGVLGENSFVSLRKIIQSQVFQVVISPNHFGDMKIFRSFQLLTEKSNTTLFLTAQKQLSGFWPIALQLDISRNGQKQFQIEVLKQKYRMQEC